jgi:predicted small lipoprotein YifL
MKRALLILLALSMALSLTACKKKTAKKAVPDDASASSSSDASASGTGSGSSSADIGSEGETLPDTLPKYPSGKIGQLPSETARNVQLEALIAKEWQIPEADRAKTYYEYNKVDLNGDGKQEIFAVAIGDYTSGTGGDSALIAAVNADGSLTLKQTFTLVREPVIVSDHKTNGWNDLIFLQYGGGAKETYRLVTADKNGKYPNVGDGKALAKLGDVSGTSIVYNDLGADQADGIALTLQ